MEKIILGPVVLHRCEAIKINFSDNAAMGKYVVALLQYNFDQRIAKAVIFIFFIKNHRNYFTDLLFGQLQTKTYFDSYCS